MYDFVFGAPLPSKAESHASASAFDSCGEYLRTTRPGSAKNSVFFRMASDQTPHSIIQPPVARTSSDTQRFCACKGHPGEPTLLLKTCMAGGSSTRARSSRKSRGRRRGTRTARIGRTPGACLPNLPAHTQTTTWFRHAAQAWTRSGLAWVLAPSQDHFPPRTPSGSRHGEAAYNRSASMAKPARSESSVWPPAQSEWSSTHSRSKNIGARHPWAAGCKPGGLFGRLNAPPCAWSCARFPQNQRPISGSRPVWEDNDSRQGAKTQRMGEPGAFLAPWRLWTACSPAAAFPKPALLALPQRSPPAAGLRSQQSGRSLPQSKALRAVGGLPYASVPSVRNPSEPHSPSTAPVQRCPTLSLKSRTPDSDTARPASTALFLENRRIFLRNDPFPSQQESSILKSEVAVPANPSDSRTNPSDLWAYQACSAGMSARFTGTTSL